MEAARELIPFFVKSIFSLPLVLSLHVILASFALMFPVTSFDTWHYSHGSQLEEAKRLPWKVIKIKGHWRAEGWHMGLGARELGSGPGPATKLLCDPAQVILFLCAAVSMCLK